MAIPKHNLNLKKIIKLIGFYLLKIYKSNKQATINTGTLLPEVEKKLLPSFFSNPNFWFASFLFILYVLYVRTFFSDETKTTNKDLSKYQPNEIFPERSQEKRILALHLCCPLCPQRSVNRYVVFKQKNNNNISSVQITRGEVGKIIKKLKGWDEALVDFSIEVPARFQKIDTKSIVANVFNEGVLIYEKS